MTSTDMPVPIPTSAQAAVMAAASAASRAALKISSIPFSEAAVGVAETPTPPVKAPIYNNVSTLPLKKRFLGRKKPSVTNVTRNVKLAAVPVQNPAQNQKRVRSAMVQERLVSNGIRLLAA